jgi:hypothetical protein
MIRDQTNQYASLYDISAFMSHHNGEHGPEGSTSENVSSQYQVRTASLSGSRPTFRSQGALMVIQTVATDTQKGFSSTIIHASTILTKIPHPICLTILTYFHYLQLGYSLEVTDPRCVVSVIRLHSLHVSMVSLDCMPMPMPMFYMCLAECRLPSVARISNTTEDELTMCFFNFVYSGMVLIFLLRSNLIQRQ